ncbi:ocs element-binding factor 1-like [Musa acuminata AAA Group]|uniref:ocs element-binding factor 1-like n=1 Tax=Musa acuminata AAA Group TaxID=214697 RepID=UPI0031D4A291
MSAARSRQSLLAVNERTQKRKLSNRESARRSRTRKQQHLLELMSDETRLKLENGQILERVERLAQGHQWLESENAVLRAEVAELAESLRSLESVLCYSEEFDGVATLAVEPSDHLLRRWQPACVTASASDAMLFLV